MFKQKVIYRIILFLFWTSYIIKYNIYSLKKEYIYCKHSKSISTTKSYLINKILICICNYYK